MTRFVVWLKNQIFFAGCMHPPLIFHEPSSDSLRSKKRPEVERAPAFAGVPGS